MYSCRDNVISVSLNFLQYNRRGQQVINLVMFLHGLVQMLCCDQAHLRSSLIFMLLLAGNTLKVLHDSFFIKTFLVVF